MAKISPGTISGPHTPLPSVERLSIQLVPMSSRAPAGDLLLATALPASVSLHSSSPWEELQEFENGLDGSLFLMLSSLDG